jgi:hypothetical protein
VAIDDSGEWWIGSEPADIEHYLFLFTRSENSYATTACRATICSCSSDRFRLERAREVTRRVCAACGRTSFICREAEDWEEAIAEEETQAFLCVNCGSPEVNIGVGFAGYESPDLDAVKWFYIGVRCADCGILGCFNDGKIGWGPADRVNESI